MNDMNWSTPEYMANMAAEELGAAMARHGIGFDNVLTTECLDAFDVHIAFASIHDAEALMTLAVGSDGTPGSLYDRATASCVALSHAVERDADLSDEEFGVLVDSGWTWVVHPNMRGRRMSWHVSVDIPVSDAYKLVVNLNALPLGGTS